VVEELQLTLRAAIPKDIAVAIGTISELQGRLFPSEEELIVFARGKRRREFIAGRTAARHALKTLGLPPQAISMIDRVPVWPPRVVGSISHCDTHAISVASFIDSYCAIGVDVESNNVLPADLTDLICSPSELKGGFSIESHLGCDLATLLFSAKESVYKSLPSRYASIEFLDIEIALRLPNRSFSALVDGRRLISGAFLILGNVIVTWAFVSFPERR